MPGLTLLEKIKEYEKNPEQRTTWDASKIQRSVLGVLNKILNSRQGSSLSAPDLGMPDFTNMPGNLDLETYRNFEKTIQNIITKYEPRLSNVSVKYIEAQNRYMSIRFKIEGDIVLYKSVISLSFDTIIDPDGKITIKD